MQDKWTWHFEKNDNYTIKSGYKALMNAKNRDSPSN